MEGLTYTQAANHLTAAVSDLPEFHSTHRVAAARILGGSADTGTHNKYNNSAGKRAPKSGICTAGEKYSQGFTSTGGPRPMMRSNTLSRNVGARATKRARVVPRTTNSAWKNSVQSRSNSTK